MRTVGFITTVSATILAFASPGAKAQDVTDPYFGEALFYAHQERWFDALERLDTELAQHRRVDESHLDPLYLHVDDAEFSVGDFELNYRMHLRAGRAISAVLEADVSDEVRNEAAHRLAQIHFQKGQAGDALRVIDSIQGAMPVGLTEDVAFLRAHG